jgi:predicted RNase H-like HicB family nuclease
MKSSGIPRSIRSIFPPIFKRKSPWNVTVALLMLDDHDWLGYVTEKPVIHARGAFPASALHNVEAALAAYVRSTGSRCRPYVEGVTLETLTLPL